MKMKKMGILLAMVFLGGGLVFGGVEVSEACDSTSFFGVESCEYTLPCVAGPTGCPNFTNATGSADWWCATSGCINDCYEFGSGVLCGGDAGDDGDIDYRFCKDGDVHEISCSKDGACVGDDGGDCDASVNVVTCPKCDGGYERGTTCSTNVECRRTNENDASCTLAGTSTCTAACCDNVYTGYTCVDEACVVVADCDNNPTVEIIPVSKSAPKGNTLKYEIKVTNNDKDDAACDASRTFNVIQVQPGDWNAGRFVNNTVLIVELDVKRGDSESTDYSIKSPDAAAPGKYEFTITATDKNDSSKKHSTKGVYNVTECPVGIDPDDEFEFKKSSYSIKDGNTIKLILNNKSANSLAIRLLDPKGGDKGTSNNIAAGDFDQITHTLVATDYCGIWTGIILSAPNCSVTTNVECGGTDICKSNRCESATGPEPAVCTENITGTVTDSATGDPISGATVTPSGDGVVGLSNTTDADGAYALTVTSPSPCMVIVDASAAGCAAAPKGLSLAGGAVTWDFNLDCGGGGGGGEEGGPAAPCGLGTGVLCNPVGWGSIPEIAEGMLNYLLGLVGSIALLFLIIAGVMYMTAGGSEEKITTAKKILTGAIIGLGIVLLAYSLLAEINKILSP